MEPYHSQPRGNERSLKQRPVEVVIVSDVHLGTYGSHARELDRYLRSISPRILVLNGDIIDIWQFRKRYWPKSHWDLLQTIMQHLNNGTEVYYLTGNHDDVLRRISGFSIKNFRILDKLVLTLDGRKVWVFHGDIFDLSVKYAPWLAKLGGKSYDYLIVLNRFINNVLVRMGRERISLSKKIKNSVKQAVTYINDFEKIAIDHALMRKYDYVVCGHIHQPIIREVKSARGTVTYMNSGDWIENLTALEYADGKWRLFHYFDHFSALPEERGNVVPFPGPLPDADGQVEAAV